MYYCLYLEMSDPRKMKFKEQFEEKRFGRRREKYKLKTKKEKGKRERKRVNEKY